MWECVVGAFLRAMAIAAVVLKYQAVGNSAVQNN
jgi:hypothetical protein